MMQRLQHIDEAIEAGVVDGYVIEYTANAVTKHFQVVLYVYRHFVRRIVLAGKPAMRGHFIPAVPGIAKRLSRGRRLPTRDVHINRHGGGLSSIVNHEWVGLVVVGKFFLDRRTVSHQWAANHKRCNGRDKKMEMVDDILNHKGRAGIDIPRVEVPTNGDRSHL